MIRQMDRILGGLWGLLIGDALGVPYEFNDPSDLPPKDKIEFNPPDGFVRSHRGVLPGTWSDDGAQALCLLDSLLECKTMDIHNFASKLLAWYENGLWAVDNKVFDVGNQTAASLREYKNGMPPNKSGFIIPDGKGNGSLMRVLPLALWHKGDNEELVYFAHLQSLVTHGHEINQVCCALYCLWAKGMMNDLLVDEAYKGAVKELREIYRKDSQYYNELEYCLRPDDEPFGKGGGYVVDSFRSVRMVLNNEDSYEAVVKAAVSLGHDTDTTAAIAGGLAGIAYGFDSMPDRWVASLRGREELHTLINGLLLHHGVI
ncbi:ADP-ribosylglycohydrolase family protein [Pseudobacteroides cellulosolvens]|uniref:ADP-ribosylation/Crystallin J1 n=1 Tax=Pseudobacteroides cellulosolvens ATCC 35603 = DSM 2933 TaxID=398512 RepID=A0A0L6JHI1_9FIRM|nr:ADP-ribosylglycohydrolase family protein [Pseudobacteroides cellulosolvens]KNY25170.1 ADP-ribosylation/Crystallin J1 [Pseudobacteroides cellulosolvens ATCC 35603 = DSM 2933]